MASHSGAARPRLRRTSTPHPHQLAELLEEAEESTPATTTTTTTTTTEAKPPSRRAKPRPPPRSKRAIEEVWTAAATSEPHAESAAKKHRAARRQETVTPPPSPSSSSSTTTTKKAAAKKKVVFHEDHVQLHVFPDEDPDHRRPEEETGELCCRCTERKGAKKGKAKGPSAALCVDPTQCPCAAEGVKCHPRWGSIQTTKRDGRQIKCYCTNEGCQNPAGRYYHDLAALAALRSSKVTATREESQEQTPAGE
jgi:hypothetical protein